MPTTMPSGFRHCESHEWESDHYGPPPPRPQPRPRPDYG